MIPDRFSSHMFPVSVSCFSCVRACACRRVASLPAATAAAATVSIDCNGRRGGEEARVRRRQACHRFPSSLSVFFKSLALAHTLSLPFPLPSLSLSLPHSCYTRLSQREKSKDRVEREGKSKCVCLDCFCIDVRCSLPLTAHPLSLFSHTGCCQSDAAALSAPFLMRACLRNTPAAAAASSSLSVFSMSCSFDQRAEQRREERRRGRTHGACRDK